MECFIHGESMASRSQTDPGSIVAVVGQYAARAGIQEASIRHPARPFVAFSLADEVAMQSKTYIGILNVIVVERSCLATCTQHWKTAMF